MGLAAFNRMRIRQIEKFKPENIIKAQEEAKANNEVVKVTTKEEVKPTTTRKSKAND